MNVKFLTNIFIYVIPMLIPVITFMLFYLIFSSRKNRFVLQYYNQYIPVLENKLLAALIF